MSNMFVVMEGYHVILFQGFIRTDLGFCYLSYIFILSFPAAAD